MKKTGVFATDEQVEALKKAMNQPYLVVGGVPPTSPTELCHKHALEQGLPEIKGFYGIDIADKEFVTV